MPLINIDPGFMSGIAEALNAPFGHGTTVTLGMVIVGFSALFLIMWLLGDER
jgi:hypothetical protein